jgi:hypothetical protein
MAGAMDEVEVVVAHRQRATLRVGEVFLKVDGNAAHAEVEVRAMRMAPVPTPAILWHQPPVLAIAAVPGTALGRLGEPSAASPAAWAATGAAVRRLHDAPPPPWPGRRLDDVAARLDRECAWLLAHAVLPAEVVRRNRVIAEAALRPWPPVFVHGDLQITHVFVAGDRGDRRHRLVRGRPRRRHVRPRHADARARGAPGRPARRLRRGRGPGRDPRVVVAAQPGGLALADRARLRSRRAGVRVRRAQGPDARTRGRRRHWAQPTGVRLSATATP